MRYIVTDVDAAIAFYTSLLEFQVKMHPAPGFAALERGDLTLLLNAPGAGGAGQEMPDGSVPGPGGWNRFQLEVEDLDVTVAHLREQGATFRSEIVVGRGGRQILVEDPSGNAVELFESTREDRKKADEGLELSSLRHDPTEGLYGWITHTELASEDPDATKAWCASVLGWTFKESFPTPNGDYHLFAYSNQSGGGIRRHNPPEIPGTIPYVHVPDARAAFDKALAEGAEEMLPPTPVMEGVTVAIVRAPGGVPIGFSGP